MSIDFFLGSALGLFVAYFGFGFVLSLPVLSSERFSRLERWLTYFSLSVGCLTLLMFFLGILGILTPLSLFSSIFVVCSLCACLWLHQLRTGRKNLDLRLKLFQFPSVANPAVLIILTAIATLLFLASYHAFMFPQILWDTLTVYAFLGKRIYLDGRIPFFSGSSGSVEWSGNYPMLVPMLYAWFNFSLGEVNDLLGRSISWVFGVATLVATYTMAKRLFDQNTALFSVYILAVTPMFLAHAMLSYIDIVLTYYFAVALYFAYTACEDMSTKRAYLAGFMGGLAAWTKYQGLFLVFIITVYWLMMRARDRTVDRIFLRILLVLAISGSAWYVRNWLLLGNPVYPNLFQLFGGRNLDGWLFSHNYNYWIGRWSVQLGTDRSYESLIRLPLTLFIRDNSVFSLGQDGVGFLLACFAIPGLLLSLAKRTDGDLLLLNWVLTLFSLWFISLYYFIRYLLPLLPAFAISSGRLLNLVVRDVKKTRAPLRVFLLIIIAIPLITAFFIPTGVLALIGPTYTFRDYVFSRPFMPPSSEEALRHAIPADYALWQFINRETPRNAVFLTLDHRWYYVDRALVFADSTEMRELYFISNTPQAVDFLASANVTYIVAEPWYSEMPLWYKSPLFRGLDNTTYFVKVFDEQGFRVYKIKGG